MTTTLALLVGGLYAAGLYLMMRRSIAKLIVGLGLMSHAAHVLVFTAGGLVRAGVPVIVQGATEPSGPVADPLPQAMILTAIVINFGVTAFAVVLIYRSWQTVGTEDLDEMWTTER